MKSKTLNNLIIITFLIAVFFIGKYIWEVYPRYEIQERIELCDGEHKECISESCDIYYSHSCSYYARYEIGVENVASYYCQEDGDSMACYIKEKVRIN